MPLSCSTVNAHSQATFHIFRRLCLQSTFESGMNRAAICQCSSFKRWCRGCEWYLWGVHRAVNCETTISVSSDLTRLGILKANFLLRLGILLSEESKLASLAINYWVCEGKLRKQSLNLLLFELHNPAIHVDSRYSTGSAQSMPKLSFIISLFLLAGKTSPS